MKQLLRSKVWAFALMLAGCAQLGLPTADTLNQRLAVGYGTVTQIATTTSQLLAAKKITADDAQNVHTQATTAKAGLDIAKSLVSTSPAAAQTKLEATLVVLQAMQTYLSEKGK